MINIRPIQEADNHFLWDMLFEMIYFPEGIVKPNKEKILRMPNISKYLDGFGLEKTDSGFVAENEKNELIAAGWIRFIELNAL